MAINNFIPAVWSAQLLKALDKSLVYANLANRDYEGEIKSLGDQVKINSLGEVSIGTYAKNTNIDAAETLDDAQRILLINQGKYFNFQIDDVDKAQQVSDAEPVHPRCGLCRGLLQIDLGDPEMSE